MPFYSGSLCYWKTCWGNVQPYYLFRDQLSSLLEHGLIICLHERKCGQSMMSRTWCIVKLGCCYSCCCCVVGAGCCFDGTPSEGQRFCVWVGRWVGDCVRGHMCLPLCVHREVWRRVRRGWWLCFSLSLPGEQSRWFIPDLYLSSWRMLQHNTRCMWDGQQGAVNLQHIHLLCWCMAVLSPLQMCVFYLLKGADVTLLFG